MTTMKIKYVEETVRASWQTLKDLRVDFSESEIVEMCNRYQDTQRHAIAYRKRAQVKQALMKERLAQLEAQVASMEEAEQS
jgi:hypothetical protein